jgi:hypothetical protein
MRNESSACRLFTIPQLGGRLVDRFRFFVFTLWRNIAGQAFSIPLFLRFFHQRAAIAVWLMLGHSSRPHFTLDASAALNGECSNLIMFVIRTSYVREQ